MKNELENAKKYAFRLLKFRMRSKKEIEFRLKQKKFSNSTIRKVIDFLVDLGYVDDLNFARMWIKSRLQFKPKGVRFLKYELRQKGIDEQIIEEVVKSLNKELEYRLARELAVRRLEKLQGNNRQVIQRRLLSFLGRRGFDTALTLKIVKGLIGK